MIKSFLTPRILFFFLSVMISLSPLSAQQTVFAESFNAPGTPQNSAFTTSGAIAGSKWNVTRSGGDMGAKIDAGMLTLTNDASAASNVSGWVMASTLTSNYNSLYKSTLNQNVGVVSWTFNMRQIRANPSGFAVGKFGVAFILAGTPGTTNTTGKGYAIVLGQTTATDPIRLATYANGIASLSPKLTSKTTGLGDFGAEYSSIRVEYNPADNKWSLYVRKDNSTSFLDPASGNLVFQEELVINDYVNESLALSGAFWNTAAAKLSTSFFDNYSVSVETPSLTSLDPDSKIANSGLFTLTVNGEGFLPTSKIKWNGVDRPTTYVSATKLTAAIAATDIGLPNTVQITVVNGSFTSNALPFTIESAGVPVLTLSATSLNSVSTVTGTASIATNTYTISGIKLIEDATVTAPANFEISTDGISYYPVIILEDNVGAGTLTGQPITLRARLKASALPASYTGSISHSTSGATTKLVAVSGRVFATEPLSNATGIAFSNITSTGFKLDWVDGTGAQRLVLIKQAAAVDALPVDGITYNANNAFGTGSQIGTGNFVVYKGSGNSLQIIGLQPSTAYYISIVEFNGLPGTENYRATGTTGTTTTLNSPVGLQVKLVNTSYKINFDATVDGVNLNTFQGLGMSKIVEDGQLDSNSWAFSGFASGAIAFAGNSIEDSSYENGPSDGGEDDTGIYAFNVGAAENQNYTLGIQPGGADFNPGTVTLRIQNQTGGTMTSVNVGYKVYVYNDQAASSRIRFSYGSIATGAYTDQVIADVISPATADLVAGWKAYYRSVNIATGNIANNAYYYIRWSGSLVSGTGSQDEFAIDDIEVIANPTTNTVAFDGIAEDFVLQGNASLSNDLSVQTRLLFNGGKLAIKDKSLTVAGSVTNTTANGLTGSVTSKLVVRGIQNPTLSFDQTTLGTTNVFNSFSLTGANPNIVTVANAFSVNQLLQVDALQTLDLVTIPLGGTLTSIQNNGSILTQNTSATPFTPGKIWAGTGILNLNAASTAQTLVAGTYNNLTLSSIAGTTASADVTVNGKLDLPKANASATAGSLSMGTNTLTMGPDGTNTGIGDVTGIIKRDYFTTNKLYTFGHPNSSITFPPAGTLPSMMSAKLTIGVAPTWRAGTMLRQFDIIQTGAVDTKAIIRQHYLDSELNSNQESKLVFWAHTNSPVNTFDQGRSNNNTTDNWVEISNANVGLYFKNAFDQVYITLDETSGSDLVWNGSTSTSWTTSANWTPAGVPSASTKVTIPNVSTASNRYPVIDANSSVKTITIEAGAIVNTPTNSVLNVFDGGGAWQNNGIFNPGNGTVIFNSIDATISGSTTFNNLSITTGAGLRALEGNYMSIAGSLTNGGTMFTTLIPNIIEFTGTNQTIPAPGGESFGGYHHLVVSGTGAVVAPSISTLNLRGSLTLNQPLSFTGKILNLAGIADQTIGGTAPSLIFDNLVVNKETGKVLLAKDITIGGTLTLTKGNLIIGTNTLTLGLNPVSGTFRENTMIVADGTGSVRRPYAGTGSYLFPIGEETGAPFYSPITVNITSATSFTNAFVAVNTKDEKHPDNFSLQNYIRHYWNVQQTGITGAKATITAKYESLDINGPEKELAAAQLNGVFNTISNPWIKFGALSNNTLVAENAALTNGQTSVFTGLKAAAFSVEVFGYGDFCSGTEQYMTAVVSGGDAPFSYLWSPVLENTAVVKIPTAAVGTTNYSLTVRDANGFTASDNSNPVKILPASVGGFITTVSQQICAGTLANDLYLDQSVGQVLHWQKSTDPNFSTFENLSNFTRTLTGAEIGPLTETTYFRAILQNGTCEEKPSAAAEVIIKSTTWNGSSWSNGVPDELTSAVFTGNYSTSTGNIKACSCEVGIGSVLTIGADTHITIENNIVNNGSIVVESEGNLLQISDTAANSGNIIVKRNLSSRSNERKEYNYFISPVEGANLKTDIYKKADETTAVTAPFVLYHQESNNKFYNSSGAYIAGRSLAVKEPALSSDAVATAYFRGKPFNGLLTYPLAYSDSYTGYNLVGNPYPSNIDLNLLYLNNSTAIEATFRFWDNTVNAIYEQQGSGYSGSAYAIYNATSGRSGTGVRASGNKDVDGAPKTPNHIVKIAQGFMVKSSGPGKVLQYSNHLRLSDNAGSVFYGKATEDDRYWLQMTAPSGITSTIAVVYYEGGNNLFGEEDSRSLDSSDQLYSIVENEKVAINGRAPFIKTDVIPLGSKHFVSGNYTIALDEKEGIFSNGQNIFLKDKQTSIITNLSSGNYTFAANAGESAGRFEIVYVPEIVLSTDTALKEEVSVYRDRGDFVIKAQTRKITEVELFDAGGRLICMLQPNSTKVVLPAEQMVNGVYVLKINQNGQITSKKIIR